MEEEMQVGYGALSAMRRIYDNSFRELVKFGAKLDFDFMECFNALDMQIRYGIKLNTINMSLDMNYRK